MSIHRLLDLQDHDLATDQARHRRAHLPERTELDEAQQARARAEAALEAATAAHGETQAAQEVLEAEVATLEEKVAKVDRNLYGGGVTDAGDLQALQHELDMLKGRRAALEDDLLEAMEAAETTSARVASAQAALEEADQRVATAAGALAEADAALGSEIDELEAARAALVTDVGEALAGTYDRLRSKGISPAVARLVGATCGGCHLTLPATEVDRIKHQPPEAEVFCDQCGCLLVRGAPAAG